MPSILIFYSFFHTLSSSSPKSTLSKNEVETPNRASFGHSVNQSMVQQLTSEGNIRHLVRKAFPTGLIHNTIWRLFLKKGKNINY